MTQNQNAASVREPPSGLAPSLRFLGPGLILSAAIVGSGELIATTALGARAGFVLLWAIILSCVIKVAIQVQYGRHTIMSGRPAFEAWNTTHGPRLFGVHWSLYGALLFMLTSWLGMSGVIGASAQVLMHAFPGSRAAVWVPLLAVSLALMVFRGKYGQVERVAAVFNFTFLSTVLYCTIAAQTTRFAFSAGDIGSGLLFRFPPEGFALLAAVFGITGVGSGEIVMYTYWCIEKGYAAWAGPRDGSAEWAARARGWIRVMRLDAMVSMMIYTVATCAFYLLGASVLQRQARLADGSGLILQLSRIFAEVLGEGSTAVFMLCAFSVLYSTMFSNNAGLSRLWADLLRMFRVIDPEDERQSSRALAILAWLLPAVWTAGYFAVRKPLGLVVVMGISNAVFLLVVAWQAMVFRYRHTDRRLLPSRAFDAALWTSVVTIAVLALRLGAEAFR